MVMGRRQVTKLGLKKKEADSECYEVSIAIFILLLM